MDYKEGLKGLNKEELLELTETPWTMEELQALMTRLDEEEDGDDNATAQKAPMGILGLGVVDMHEATSHA